MVYVVRLASRTSQFDEEAGSLHHVLFPEDAFRQWQFLAESLIELEPANFSQVIFTNIEEIPLEKAFGVGYVWRVPRTHSAVNLFQRLFSSSRRVAPQAFDKIVVPIGDMDHEHLLDLGVLEEFQRGFVKADELVQHLGAVGVDYRVYSVEGVQIIPGEQLRHSHRLDLIDGCEDVLVGFVSNRPEECGYEEFPPSAVAVEIDVYKVVRVELDLHPRAAVGNYSERVEGGAASVLISFEAYAWRAVQLADDNAFNAVDDEGPLPGDNRHLTDVDLLFDRLAAFFAQSERGVQRGAVGVSVLDAVYDSLVGVPNAIGDVVQLQLSVEALYREYLAEGFVQSALPFSRRDIPLEELLVGIDLDAYKVRNFQDVRVSAKILAI